MQLNEQQRAIVNTSGGKVAVVAGAGSGKSTTNVELIVKLHIQDDIPLSKFWISTFTNKAGRDLKQKLKKRLDLSDGALRELWVGTFHSLGYRYLTQLRKLKLEIILPVEANHYLRNIYKQIIKDDGIDEGSVPFKEVFNGIEKYRNEECSWEDASKHPETSQKVYNMYQSEKQKMDIVDYTDILYKFSEELKKDDQFTRRFEWVFVDESQDNSKKQNYIASQLTTKNQVFIGDPKQSIYAFRGAAPHIFKEKIISADKVYDLAYNYRSSKEIIEFANSLLSQMPSFVGQNLIPTKSSCGKPVFTLCNNSAYQIFRAIQLDIRKGIPLEEIAVLGRSIKPLMFQSLQVLLRQNNIPYIVRGGDDKLNASFIQNYLSVLKSVIRPTKVSLVNSLSILPSVGPKTAMKLAESVVSHGGSFEPLLEATGRYAQTKAFGDYCRLQDISYDNKELLLGTLDFIYNHHLVPKYGKKDPNDPSNKKNMIFDVLYDYLMGYSNLMEGIDSLYINEEDLESEKGKIVISTIHQSKGLEWESVHIANFNENSIPNLKPEDENNQIRIEEEFCIAYVAITRAKKHLRMYMSFMNGIHQYAKPNKLSRFLKEIFKESKENYFTFNILDVESRHLYKEKLYNLVQGSSRKQDKIRCA